MNVSKVMQVLRNYEQIDGQKNIFFFALFGSLCSYNTRKEYMFFLSLYSCKKRFFHITIITNSNKKSSLLLGIDLLVQSRICHG